MLLTVLAGTLFTLIVFYPGFMSPDSIAQLTQARSGAFTDWHPPLMSWLWAFFDRLVPGPIGMLLLHSIVFWSSLGLWMMLIAPKWPAIGRCLAVLVVGLFPSVFAPLGTVWKDSAMVAACMLGCALLLLAERKRSLVALLFGLLALWYAIAVRYNAVVAVLPLVVYASKEFYRQRLLSPALWRWRDLVAVSAIAVGVMALMLVADSAVTHRLTRGKSNYPVQQILIHDLTAISIETGSVLVPERFFESEPLAVSDLEKIYSPRTVVPLFCCDDSVARLKTRAGPNVISGLQHTWLDAVLAHPMAYFRHRIQVLGRMLGITEKDVCYPYQQGIVQNNLGVVYEETAFQHTFFKGLWRIRNGFFRAWTYMAVLAISVTLMIWKRATLLSASRLPLAIAISGLLYGLAYLFIGTSCDFRMHYWTAAVAVLLVVSLALVSSEARFTRSPGSPESR